MIETKSFMLYIIKCPMFEGLMKIRSVAQFGRALRSGRRGRRFKSCHFDGRGLT